MFTNTPNADITMCIKYIYIKREGLHKTAVYISRSLCIIGRHKLPLGVYIYIYIYIARRVSGCSEVRIIHMSVLYKGGGDFRIHGFIYMDFSNFYVT